MLNFETISAERITELVSDLNLPAGHPVVSGAEPPPLTSDTARLLDLVARWRDAALERGEFAPTPMLGEAPDVVANGSGGREVLDLLCDQLGLEIATGVVRVQDPGTERSSPLLH